MRNARSRPGRPHGVCVVVSVQSDRPPPWKSTTLYVLSPCEALTQQCCSRRLSWVIRVLSWTLTCASPLEGLKSKVALQLHTQVRITPQMWSCPQLAMAWQGSVTCDGPCRFRSISKCKLACSIFRKVTTIVIKVGLILIYPKQVDTTQQSKTGWFRKVLMEFFTIFIKLASY